MLTRHMPPRYTYILHSSKRFKYMLLILIKRRKMKKGRFFALSIFCVFLFLMIMAISAVSAEIMLNQPGEVYNLDDELFVSAALKSPADSSGLFRMSLLCNANEKDFYISP